MDKEWMPKVDLEKDSFKLKDVNIALMREIEKQNLERVQRLKKLRKSNKILGLTLGATVLSVYFYTMYTVRQERFLDDFNEPDAIADSQAYK